ncbi:hypothetical protein FRC03_005919 [Tulasnella sp. 419]|nr:hypothetical protein FRC03_005919 [Tulasnella sp. 419]
MRSPVLPMLSSFGLRRRPSVTFTIVTPGAIVATMERLDDHHSTTCTPGDLSPRYSNVEGFEFDFDGDGPKTPPNRSCRALPDVFVYTPEEEGIGSIKFCAFSASDPPSPPTPDLSRLAEALEALERLTDNTPPFRREAGRSLEELVVMPKRKHSSDLSQAPSTKDNQQQQRSALRRHSVSQVLRSAVKSIRMKESIPSLRERIHTSEPSLDSRPRSLSAQGSSTSGEQPSPNQYRHSYPSLRTWATSSTSWVRKRTSNGRLRKLFSSGHVSSPHSVTLDPSPVIDITHLAYLPNVGPQFPSLLSKPLPSLPSEAFLENRGLEEVDQTDSSATSDAEISPTSPKWLCSPDISSDSPLSKLKRSSIAARRLKDDSNRELPSHLTLDLSALHQKYDPHPLIVQDTGTSLFSPSIWDSQFTPALSPTSLTTVSHSDTAATSSQESEIPTPIT